jgi:hypothetical protein
MLFSSFNFINFLKIVNEIINISSVNKMPTTKLDLSYKNLLNYIKEEDLIDFIIWSIV